MAAPQNSSSVVSYSLVDEAKKSQEIPEMLETRIYVGLNDLVEKKQLFETETFINIMRNVCYAYKTPFSFNVEEDGYIHEDGTYTRENTLVLTLIDTEKAIVAEIAKDLCVFFHQESVLITESPVNSYYISESLEKQL